MREHSESDATGGAGRPAEPDQSAPPGRGPATGKVAPESALKLAPNITAAEALAVFRRKLPGAEAEVREALHPFWWTVLSARTRSLFRRSPKPTAAGSQSVDPTAGQLMNVLVNAYSGKGFIADFDPRGEAVTVDEWLDAFESSDQAGPQPGPGDVRRTARSLVRTKVVKTVKLGMGLSITEAAAPSGILKPNWVVTGANDRFSSTILVDGLDSSHYIVRVAKL
ncbi:hypothetical protein SAMN04489751_0470 [Brevibacterium sandarakinum]|uniref:Uncharacterized protein n=1 Tax=Brevibacterium sandarakinum TaxID=629680 RepID=A0A1H1LYG0_BRESA|nr:hypothetical protein [Brevibacterium sandarakinum]SDR79437.1 hypothetical protein SAMN04489751_0470 [Brevibacterium sandarakinum]